MGWCTDFSRRTRIKNIKQPKSMSGCGFSVGFSRYEDEDRGIGFQPVVQNRTHNPPNELLAVASQSVTHDAIVARLSVSDFTPEIYFQDGQQTIADSPSAAAAGSVSYTHVDAPVMRGGSGGLRYYHRNQRNSITAVSDGGGSVVERYAYTAYGQVAILDSSLSPLATSAEGNRYTYTGREWDEGLSLYHYRARMYDAVAGRFTSRAPIGYAGSKWNVFCYTSSSPASSLDPTGLVQIRCGCDRFDMNGNMSGNTVTYNVYVDCRGGYFGCCRNACSDTDAPLMATGTLEGQTLILRQEKSFAKQLKKSCGLVHRLLPSARPQNSGQRLFAKFQKRYEIAAVGDRPIQEIPTQRLVISPILIAPAIGNRTGILTKVQCVLQENRNGPTTIYLATLKMDRPVIIHCLDKV